MHYDSNTAPASFAQSQPKKTKLEAFFSLCNVDSFASTILYHQVPEFYVWSETQRSWNRRKIGGTRLLQPDGTVIIQSDINPKAPVHILIVPNKLIPTINDIEDCDELMLGRLFTVAKNIAKSEGISDNGYRLIMNCNQHGGQEVYHIHMHLVGGEPLGPMLMNL